MSHIHPELSAPPPLAPGALRVIPLGGLGEIGRNMTVFEFGGKLLIVDCGVLFPEEHHPGVDLILPDFSPIRDRLDDVVGIVLTHGHEHVAASDCRRSSAIRDEHARNRGSARKSGADQDF